jgi:Acetyltransferase (GNAT) domain
VQLFTIDPLSDSRWDDLVTCHPRSSAFHQRAWLEALSSTYGYAPLVLTGSPPGQALRDGLVFCRVSSWITGTRLVSLPFSDHCEPLAGEVRLPEYFDWLRTECDRHRYGYVEIRPLTWSPDEKLPLPSGRAYYVHTLDLTPSPEKLFRSLHKDSMQRRIRRAEKEHLSYEVGRSDQLLEEFCRLQLITRRRHQLIPQPKAWFRNLVRCMGENLQIRLARRGTVPIAALLALRHRSSIIYKYGCSDARFHHLGAMPFLFWRFIDESRAAGAEEMDLGRSDLDQQGLITFKDRLGASKRRLHYIRYSISGKPDAPGRLDTNRVRRIFPLLPDLLLLSAGRILYKHLG